MKINNKKKTTTKETITIVQYLELFHFLIENNLLRNVCFVITNNSMKKTRGKIHRPSFIMFTNTKKNPHINNNNYSLFPSSNKYFLSVFTHCMSSRCKSTKKTNKIVSMVKKNFHSRERFSEVVSYLCV